MKTSLLKLIWRSPLALCVVANSQASSLKGSGSDIPACYDHQIFTIQFVEFSPGTEPAPRRHNHNFNCIHQSDAGLPGNQLFNSVIDAVPADGFIPLWLEIQITFLPDHTPRQLFSDDESRTHLMLGKSLETTGELYWGPVVGSN